MWTKLSNQVLEPKIKILTYSLNGKNYRMKVKVFGKIREGILDAIDNTLHFIPDPFKAYLFLIESIEIRKAQSNSTGIFNTGDYSMKIYDHPAKEETDYSETFLHELGHLIFHQYIMICETIEEKANENPVDTFVDDIKDYKIKPITEYLGDLENDKKFNKLKYDYPNELFAGYFAFTYSRYSDETEVKGSFTNYIKLRNLFFALVDDVETNEFNPFNQD